jgi:hypothetical protein
MFVLARRTTDLIPSRRRAASLDVRKMPTMLDTADGRPLASYSRMFWHLVRCRTRLRMAWFCKYCFLRRKARQRVNNRLQRRPRRRLFAYQSLSLGPVEPRRYVDYPCITPIDLLISLFASASHDVDHIGDDTTNVVTWPHEGHCHLCGPSGNTMCDGGLCSELVHRSSGFGGSCPMNGMFLSTSPHNNGIDRSGLPRRSQW